LNRFKTIVLGLILFAVLCGFIVADNIIDPVGFIPTLENRFWGGYYDGPESGKVWCIAKFYKHGDGLRMIVITSDQHADIFDVEQDSSGANFVEFTFRNSRRTDKNIAAKQLYEGKRYMIGRIFAGRWKDFWQQNEDVAIRGKLQNSKNTFAVEPLAPEKVVTFYNDFVKHVPQVSTDNELSAYLEGCQE
jgi:hypothetical protein